MQVLQGVVTRIDALLAQTIIERNFSETRPTTGLLNYGKLLTEGVIGLFRDEKIARMIPQIVVQDLNDAIRCLAYGVPTPSVMIALRAMEGMLRHAHQRLSKMDLLEPSSQLSWGSLLEQVSKGLARTGIAMLELEGYLTYVRTIRNEAAHPERRFSVKEAEDMLIHVQYAMSELQKLLDLIPIGEEPERAERSL